MNIVGKTDATIQYFYTSDKPLKASAAVDDSYPDVGDWLEKATNKLLAYPGIAIS